MEKPRTNLESILAQVQRGGTEAEIGGDRLAVQSVSRLPFPYGQAEAMERRYFSWHVLQIRLLGLPREFMPRYPHQRRGGSEVVSKLIILPACINFCISLFGL